MCRILPVGGHGPLLLALCLPLVAPAAAATAIGEAGPDLDRLTIIAPGSTGGGWDQTGRAMKQALEASGLAGSVEVVNSPGAIGLAQFLIGRRGDGNALLLGGLVMVGSIRTSHAAVSLLETTPIARLTGEYEVIAVPASSEIKSLSDLVEALRTNPGSVSWVGGSVGGSDQMLIGLIARALGIEPLRMSYTPFSGGGEVAEVLAAGGSTVGVSGYGELEPFVRSGKIRALAISAESRLPGTGIGTLKEQGLDVSFVNWRGVFAPPGSSEEQRARLGAAIDAMVKSDAWKRALETHRWRDLYLPGDAFAQFVREEDARIESGPDPRGVEPAGRSRALWLSGTRFVRARPLTVVAMVVGVLAAVAALLGWQRSRSRRREEALLRDLETAREHAKRSDEETRELLRGLGVQIDKEFETWRLTSAEREVAHLMLKGLRHKEIANVRGTSERTVRQQALTIYKKAGLEGRGDLAAYFLEDLLPPSEANKRPA
jgi:putative tricarboxylic transport membrane protein